MASDRTDAGRRALAERARRVTTIRRRVAGAAVGAFALAWGLIAATGSMGAESAATTAATQATAASASTMDESSQWTTPSSGETLAPVTTGQS